jgi:hypothetical protein
MAEFGKKWAISEPKTWVKTPKIDANAHISNIGYLFQTCHPVFATDEI